MADGDEIKNTDLVQEDAFGDFKNSAKEAYEMLKLLDEGIVSLGKNMKNAFNKPADIGNIKELEDYLGKLKQVDELEKTHTTVLEKKAKAAKVLTVEEQKLKVVTAEQNKINKEIAKDQLGLITAYQKASKALNELRDSYKNLALQGRENGIVGRALLQTITEQDQKLKNLDGTVGQHQRNVGNYTKSIIILQKGLGGLTGLVATIGRTFGFSTEYLEGFHLVSKTLIKTSKELSHTLHLEHLGHKENTGAILEENAAEEASGIAKTLSLGAIGLIIAATAALAGGIWYLVNAQEESYQETLKEIKAHNALEGALEKEIIARAKLDKKLAETKNQTAALTGKESEAEVKRKELLMNLNVEFGELQHEKNEAIRKEEEYYIEQHHLGVRNATKYHEDALIFIERKYAIKRKELLRQYAAEEEQINDESLLQQGEVLEKKIKQAEDAQKIYNETSIEWLNLQKQILIFRSEQQKIADNAYLYDINSTSQKRIEDSKKLNKELEDLQINFLKKQLANDLQSVHDSEDSVTLKNAKIFQLNKKFNIEVEKSKEETHENDLKKIDEESKAMIAEMDRLAKIELDRLIKDEDEKRKIKIDEFNDEMKLRLAKANTQKEIDKATLENNNQIRKKELDDLDQALQYGLISQQDYETKREIIVREGYKEVKKIRDKEIDDAEKVAKDILEIKQRYNEFDYKNKTDFLNRQNQMLDDDMKIQAQLLSEGKANQYAQEQKARAENMAKQADLDKKAYRQKKAQALAETFLEFLKVYAKDGWSGVAKAAAATTSGEILAELFAGSAKDGTADTGSTNGPGLDGQGGMPWLIHPKEAIITAEGNADNPGLAQAMIDGTVDEYFKTNFLPTMNMGDILPGNQDSMLLSVYIAKTDELIKTVKNKKETTYSRNYLGETVRDEVENGIHSIITEKKYKMQP